MRNVVIGSFVGFVLAAAFLAACGGAGKETTQGPIPQTTGGLIKWSGLGTRFAFTSGFNLTSGARWASTAIYENGLPAGRNQYASFEVRANVDSAGASTVTMDLGILASVDGSFFSTEPQWVGSLDVAAADNRRATFFNVRIPPTHFKVMLRLRSSSSATARVSSLVLVPYGEVTP